MLAYNPDRADAGMERWSRLTAQRYVRGAVRGQHSPAFRAVIASSTPATSISMFIGGMKTYFIFSQVNKHTHAALLGTLLQLDAAGHRPWMWPLKYALPCLQLHAGDAIATSSFEGSLTWAAYVPRLPRTQRHICAQVQTEGAFRAIVVLVIGNRAKKTAWPQGTVRAVLSVVDGSDVMACTRLHCGSTVTVEIMTSRSGKRHLYLCSVMRSFQPLFVLQLAL